MGVYDYHHDSGKPDRPQPTLYEKRPEITKENPNKVYVEVWADFKDGVMKPLMIIWTDGRKYPIDRVERCDRASSLKAGGVGMRYVCRIMGQRTELFYEENGMWFVCRKAERRA